MADSSYPLHEKVKALGGDNKVIGAFLDWLLNSQRCEIRQFHEERSNGEPEYIFLHSGEPATEVQYENLRKDPRREWRVGRNPEHQIIPAGMYVSHNNIEDWIGLYFGIDPYQLSLEKDQILADFRKKHYPDETN